MMPTAPRFHNIAVLFRRFLVRSK